jgi:hypothetical protein
LWKSALLIGFLIDFLMDFLIDFLMDFLFAFKTGRATLWRTVIGVAPMNRCRA